MGAYREVLWSGKQQRQEGEGGNVKVLQDRLGIIRVTDLTECISGVTATREVRKWCN